MSNCFYVKYMKVVAVFYKYYCSRSQTGHF